MALKEIADETYLVSIGISFHSLRGMIEKALAPHVVVLDPGVTSKNWSEEHGTHAGE